MTDTKAFISSFLKRTVSIASASFIFMSTSAFAADLYVSTAGNDLASGASSAPLKTILKASTLARTGTATTIHVAPGTYTGGFLTNADGTASARLRYVSEVPGAAKIVPGSGKVMWDNRGDYNDIIGFEFDGSGSTSTYTGLYIGGSYNLIQSNLVHHIATGSTCNSGGGAAIGADHYYYGVKNDIIGNTVHHIGTATCTFIQGIYFSTSGNVKNNVVYNVGAAAIHLWHDANEVNIINNTVAASGLGIIVGGGDFYHSTNGMADYINVFNNIVFDNEYGVSEQGVTGSHNLYKNNLVFQNSTKDWDLDAGKTQSGSIATNPQFVSYNRTGTSVDYHLKSTSPAIDRGVSSLAPASDIANNARPQGLGYDLGAYEFPTAASSPTPSPTPAPVPPSTGTTVTLSSTSLTFTAPVGTTSASQLVTLKNTGTAPFTIPSGFVMTGDFAFGGTGTCSLGVSYAPGTSCTASVVFKPTATGTRTGTLSILTSASSTAMVVKLTGNLVPAPLAKLSVTSLTFGPQRVNTTSAIQVVTITNIGNAPMKIPSAFVMTGDFGFGGTGTCSLDASYAPGMSCTASVVFKPKATGRRTGSLSLRTNASSTPMVVKLSGSGY